LLVFGLLVLERTVLIEIDEEAIQPEVVSCQIGHKDMEVRVQGSRAAYCGEVVPRYEFWLPRSAGAPCTTGTDPRRTNGTVRTSPAFRGAWMRSSEKRGPAKLGEQAR
jgi:hypothetical protein